MQPDVTKPAQTRHGRRAMADAPWRVSTIVSRLPVKSQISYQASEEIFCIFMLPFLEKIPYSLTKDK
ncbi:hypothetical protein [Coleofasciculus sp.]|uniref:hypothetical protein n=1 Tax=Coleofasciculus sp. TaxID=3100458 RepID=UPI003A3953B8